MSRRAPISSTKSGAPCTCASIPGSKSICGTRVVRKLRRPSNDYEQARPLSRARKNSSRPGGKLLSNVLHLSRRVDSYSCIFSTRPQPKAELVRLYFDKDVVEKAFRSLKGVVKLQPIRHWLARSASPPTFLSAIWLTSS